jgi:MATE family multidrug resistance protein
MKIFPRNSYYKDVLRLAIPAIAGLATQMVVSLTDAAFVGRLSEAKYALAAMGIGVLATWALVSFFSSLATGTHVMVARRFGQKDYDGCSRVLYNSLLTSVIIGLVVMAIALFLARPAARHITADPLVGKYAGDFIFYRFLGIPFFLISVSYRGFYFGINRTKIFMFSGVITNVLNIIFNYTLVFGKFGIPQMGVAGAGLGSTIATCFDLFFYFAVIQSPSYRSRYHLLKNLKFDFSVIKRIFRISMPVSFQNLFILLGFLSFMVITGFIGILEQAASQAVISTLFISLLPCFGFGIAVQTLVGNNVGSGKFRLAKIYGFETAKLATYYTLFLGFIFILLPQYVLLIITTNESIIKTAIPALQIAGFAQIFYALGVVMANGLQALGKTLYVMLAESITNLFIFVPLAYFFGIYLHWGLKGAWFALPIYIVIYSYVVWHKFKQGKWEIL